MDVLPLIYDWRLGFHLESQVWKNFSAELTTVFVVGEQPPYIKATDYPSRVTQHSNGLGPMSGVALALAYWFGSKPMRGNGLALQITNYAYTYVSEDEIGKIDEVSHVDQRLYALYQWREVMGIFTLGGAAGIGYELNHERRCFPNGVASATSNCRNDELGLALSRGTGGILLYDDLHSETYPLELTLRVNVGVTF